MTNAPPGTTTISGHTSQSLNVVPGGRSGNSSRKVPRSGEYQERYAHRHEPPPRETDRSRRQGDKIPRSLKRAGGRDGHGLEPHVTQNFVGVAHAQNPFNAGYAVIGDVLQIRCGNDQRDGTFLRDAAGKMLARRVKLLSHEIHFSHPQINVDGSGDPQGCACVLTGSRQATRPIQRVRDQYG